MDDCSGELHQLLGVHCEELIARQSLNQLSKIARSMRVRRDIHRVEHPHIPCAQYGDRSDALGVRRSGIEPKEASLANNHTSGIKKLHSDVVQVSGAMHCRSGVRLGQDQRIGILRMHLRQGRQAHPRFVRIVARLGLSKHAKR